MPPGTHALIGWLVANATTLSRRDRTLITLAGVAPDVDGLGIIADIFTDDPSRPLRKWAEFHHVLGHNVFAAAGVALIVLAISQRRARTTALALVSFHLHLLCDVLGSGGPNGEGWDIAYFEPLSHAPVWSWAGQWRLDGWQNLLITAAAIGATLWLAAKRGFSPVSIFSERWDERVAAVLRGWCSRPTAGASAESASE
ncbi:MAG TPA: metal-dependent hydrolase [Candidatus Limnocylindria bacterium]|nr:metal-dependent hydrolase [Candidatus Limnocylindria bacterium]